MARKVLTRKTLNKKYGNLSQQFRDTIDLTVKRICKKEKGVLIRFKEAVYIHFINDNIYVDCRGIQLGEDGSLLFQVEIHQDGSIDEITDTLEEMDCAAYYEILLALNEKNFVVENQM